MDTGRVVIAVLTYHRPGDLLELLPALELQIAEQARPAFEVIVVDNDPEASAREVVTSHPGSLVRYVHEPAPGIAHARNRALAEAVDAELLVFIDDDERPRPGWLAALLDMHDRTGAAAVTGPVLPDYEGTPHPWLVAAGVFVRKEYPDGHQMPAAGTGNLLLDLRRVRAHGLSFDERFGLTGGSDTLFTRQLVKAGERIVYAASGAVVDKVPAGRMSRRWGLLRYYRVGNTWSRTSVELADGSAARLAARLKMTALGLARMGYGTLRAAYGGLTADLGHRARGERAIARGSGMVAGAWGSVYQEYHHENDHGQSRPAVMGTARAAYRTLRKGVKRVWSYLLFTGLWVRNLTTTQPATGDGEAIVSLTSYGPRLRQVAVAVESIARGSVRPRRLILWLAPDAFSRPLPSNLRRLQRRGLEVRESPDYGSHKKYFPALEQALLSSLPVVTADDDILYPRGWLAGLVAAARANPEIVHCYRSSRVVATDGRIAAYSAWPRNRSTTAGLDVFPTSGAGALYPAALQRALLERGTEFLQLCPKADDIWLHWVAVRTGIPMQQVGARAKLPPSLPGSQGESLATLNVSGGRNDGYVASLYTADDARAIVGGRDG